MNNNNTSSLKGSWLAIVLFGLIGQIAWSVENMYFNIFIFNYIGGTTTDIANMVAASAITATVTALFMGALSDRLKKRKIFIFAGTILWGISILAFAFISRENVSALLTNASVAQITSITVAIVIIMDCVMTFFGSTSNDGAFNSWVTNITDETNRGKVEGILSCLPMVALLIVVGGSGILIDAVGYPMFFITVGIFVILCGVLGIFIIHEPKETSISTDGYFETVSYGFRPSVIKENSGLYILFIAVAVFFSGVQIFMPYFIVYMEKFLNLDVLSYSIVLGVGILLSSIFAIICGKHIDKIGKKKFVIPAVSLYIVGLIGVFFARNMWVLLAVVTITLCGNLLVTIILNSTVRDYTPKDKAGMFQGVRLIFTVLIPMVVGPYIGNAIIQNSGATYINEYSEIVNVPVPAIYLASAIFSVFVLAPLWIFYKREKSQK
ncbi:MAG: MFS transporter [Bacillota bacterium]